MDKGYAEHYRIFWGQDCKKSRCQKILTGSGKNKGKRGMKFVLLMRGSHTQTDVEIS